MNKRIIGKEIGEMARSSRFAWSAVFLYALLAVALFDSVQYYTKETKIRNDAREATYRQWLEQGEKNPHSAAHYGFYAYKPVSSLSIVDKGLDDYLGNAVWLEAHNQNEVTGRYITDRLSLSRFGQLTPGLLFYFFVPLLLIILGYNTVSRELENATLSLLLSTGVGRKTLVVSKATALFAAVVLLTIPAFAIVVLTILISGADIAYAQLLLVFGFLLVEYAFLAMAITAVSALSRRSSIALVTMVSFWLLGVVLVPRFAGIAAKKFVPAPTAFAFYKAVEWDKENGLDGHDPGNERTKKFEQEVLARYGVDSISQLPVNFAGLSLQAGEDFGNQVFDKHFDALYYTFRSQDQVVSASALLSPFMAVRNITLGFSGSDINRHALFVQQAEDCRRHIQKVMNEDYAKGAVGKLSAEYLRDRTLWEKIDNFSFNPFTTAGLLKMQLPNILVLLTWAGIAVIFLLGAANRLTI